MATKCIRIGSADNVICYDDGDHSSALETDQPIKAGTPVDSDDVIRIEDLEDRLLPPVSVVNIDNPTELNTVAGALGAMVLAYQVVGASGLNESTLYAYDADGPAVNSPYIVDADGGGTERWVAIAGKYSAVVDYTAVRKLSVVDISNPTELTLESGSVGDVIFVYEVLGPHSIDEHTIYVYDDDAVVLGSGTPYIVDTGDGGDTRWVAIAGCYIAKNIHLNGLDTNKLLYANAVYKLQPVADLTDFIDGTANEIVVSDDGDGTVTISGDGSDTDFTVITSIQAGGAGGVGFQYKTRALTLNGGVITTVGAESSWNDV